ncbi:hypothetical protein D0U04_29085 [Bacillus clarus]|uniref:Necrosis inducing family protein n=1 Tax=Bacillus clarus TaxID=2338372 RepID=A0A090YSR3_9BACI|nr:NPP1 family protein [Bacillus clarus]KFN01297.1 necrosis inducing family protein [Bacillus clarus]RFT62120.1 hypothetical protein D0U04_29085 [Bacillus clarus]
MRKKVLFSLLCGGTLFISSPFIAASETNISQSLAHQPHPSDFLATLQFDGMDWLDSGEKNFPHAFRFQTYDLDIEHNKENEIKFQIGQSLFGSGTTGWKNRGPNDQRPAVYFHSVTKEDYEVYQYWLYYADNDWINNHEHDWEKYFVYLKNGKPMYVLLSTHNNYSIKPWPDIPKDQNHPLIGVDGGSHAMKWAAEDGVQIRFNGEISKNNGRLDVGDGSIQPWVIYSNDSIEDVQSYATIPDIFYYGDPAYSWNSNEYGDPRDAPWKRSEWNDPPQIRFSAKIS